MLNLPVVVLLAQSLTVPVVVLDRTHQPASVLQAAESEAASLFADAGITLTWSADVPSGRFARLVIDTAPNFREIPRARMDNALGLTIPPSLSYVFMGDLSKWSREFTTSLTVILGIAIAHELAHLWLPPGHAATGLMKAKWNAADFAAATAHRLRFDADSIKRIIAAITGTRPPDPRTRD